MNQTLFFEAVGRELKRKGLKIAFLCFHERSHDHLSAHGEQSFNAFALGDQHHEDVALDVYGWPSLRLVLSHEMAAFEVYDSGRLVHKLRGYLYACEKVFDVLATEATTPLVVVQELGGFLSNMASFYAARRRSIDNIFVEPSFYRERVFFVKNSFDAPRVRGPSDHQASTDVIKYLNEAIERQQIVIPQKDVRHYRGPAKKLTDLYNLRRLLEKTIDKYLLGKREEFGHLAGHVSRHLRMWRNAQSLSHRYRTRPVPPERYVYYPLHVPADVALTLRSPEYVDQYALIDYLARIVPDSHVLCIKEHPAMVGATDRTRILKLLEQRDNVRLLDPCINNYEVVRHADAVVTVNSKSGAEALLLRRPVIVLGDAFYTDCMLVNRTTSLSDLRVRLGSILAARSQPGQDAVYRYFQDVWNASFPGELYDQNADNICQFANSLARVLQDI